MHPPSGTRTSWYAYWAGLETSRSTGQSNLADAIIAAESMVRSGGRRATLDDAVLSDEEFEKVQRTHYARKTDPTAQGRAAKTLEECLDAIAAFKAITGLPAIVTASPDDCARFQREALRRPRNWRKPSGPGQSEGSAPATKGRPSKTQKRRQLAGVEEAAESLVSPNTVLKWSRMLQAAFERINRSAGKKCVRGVVPEAKFLTSNPWSQFTWIEGVETPIQHFDADELLGFVAYLEEQWADVPVGALATKVLLWSCCRKLEVAGLKWDDLRLVEGQVHFEVEGKWGVERWFRIPDPLYRQMLAHRTASPFVFAAYVDQITKVHAENAAPQEDPAGVHGQELRRWLYERVKDWAVTQPRGTTYLHIFRKTGLQFTHDGEEEETSKRVASDAGVSEAVLLGHYVKPKLWRKSNRTFRRLLASLPPAVASRYGHAEDERAQLERQLGEATEAGNWPLVAQLAERLGKRDRQKAAV